MINTIVGKLPWFNKNAGLLVLRIGVGSIFITTGFMKLSNMGEVLGTFAVLGFSPFWAYLVSIVELLGGISMLLGIYPRISAIFLAVVMIVATYVVHSDFSIVLAPVMLLFAILSILLSGGGKYSATKETP